MERVYPIILTPAEDGYMVHVLNLEIDTEGHDIADAIDMAEDAIGLWGLAREDLGQEIPAASTTIPPHASDEITAFAVVDFDAYRWANGLRTVRKNATTRVSFEMRP